MTKSSPSQKNHDIKFDDDWTSHPAIEWMTANKSIFIWIFCVLIAVLLLASRLITWRTIDAEKDFFQAQTSFTQFQEAAISPGKEAEATASLQELNAIMSRRPDLQAKYDGALAQTLLVTGEVPLAEGYIDAIFKRTNSDQLTPYRLYTQGSLLVAQTRFPEALQNAQQLKTNLEQLGKESMPTLYLFNLVRLGLLYQQTGDESNELKTWKELQNQNLDSKALLALGQAFQVGAVSLDQYIQERNKNLKH